MIPITHRRVILFPILLINDPITAIIPIDDRYSIDERKLRWVASSDESGNGKRFDRASSRLHARLPLRKAGKPTPDSFLPYSDLRSEYDCWQIYISRGRKNAHESFRFNSVLRWSCIDVV